MSKAKIFLAGASGAIGFPLASLLVEKGYQVIGTTRRPENLQRLRSVGADPVLVDVYDKESLQQIVQKVSPDIVIHQLTDLPYGLPAERMGEGRLNNNRIRLVGTKNLIEALSGLAPRRMIVQSIAFMYKEGPIPHQETDELASSELTQFEEMVLNSGFDTTVLRYGRFYGPRTGVEKLATACRVHVLAAAHAAVLAMTLTQHSVYNVCEDSEYADNSRLLTESGWNPEPSGNRWS